jgi:hypothetical protein
MGHVSCPYITTSFDMVLTIWNFDKNEICKKA